MKAFVIPIDELTTDIMKDCLQASNPKDRFSEQYAEKSIGNIRKNKNGSKAVIFYRNTKPKSCEKYPDVDWETEKEKPEWKEEEI